MDGKLPTQREFWEQYKKQLYSIARDILGTRVHDDIMDALTEAYCLHYAGMQRNYHPDYGKPFAQYVLGSFGAYVRKVAIRPKGRYKREIPCEFAEDSLIMEPNDYEPNLRLCNHDERVLCNLLLQGYSLKDIKKGDFDISQYSYTSLRALKRSLQDKVIL